MRDASFASDLNVLRKWWGELLRAEPPPESVVALWFGLFEDARGGFTLYANGLDEWDPDDEAGDWTSATPSWAPHARYVRIESLSEMSSREWETGLQRALDLVRALAPQDSWPLSSLAAVGAGFDDGELHLVWTG